MANSFIIHRINRYDISGKRIFEIGEKYYFENTGIQNVIVGGYRPRDRGKILENLAYNNLIINGYPVKIGALDNQEIDFVCKKNGEKRYLQVALTLNDQATIEREFGNLKKIKDNYPKAVITMDSFISNSEDGIVHLTLREFFNNSF
ncbi:ATPase ATPase (AAA+ superfamily) [Proteiniphilum saccharofermentans]|uniref:ATPase ATPase (AAA+ superfamily) n=1 Tax=Proteiniphilum saccharofermentans TaxID=1642647 RepID=A0A1R3T6L5_9BACT|nr:ATP-binding protein [Proteiniphilum saccharofermentans]SCD21872.1 ATPase ATPase (AAA+ superfamily) [Proteiniphilum saccharofermentans]